MDCSLPGSSVHIVFQARNTGVGYHFLLQGILLTQGIKLQSPAWQVYYISSYYISFTIVKKKEIKHIAHLIDVHIQK